MKLGFFKSTRKGLILRSVVYLTLFALIGLAHYRLGTLPEAEMNKIIKPSVFDLITNLAAPLISATLLLLTCNKRNRHSLVNGIGTKTLQTMIKFVVLMNSFYLLLSFIGVGSALAVCALTRNDFFASVLFLNIVTLEFWFRTLYVSRAIERGLRMKYGKKALALK